MLRRLELDPARPKAQQVRFEVGGGSVLATRAGYLLHTRRRTVEVTVFLCSKELRVARRTFTIQVP